MTSKKIVSVMLILFVVASIGFLGYRIGSESNAPSSDQSTPEAGLDKVVVNDLQSPGITADADVDVVFYFMTTQRCQSCMKIESFTKAAIDEFFSGELQGKVIEWKIVNVDEPANRHFIKDYELFTKSVVLVKYRGGQQVKWKNLDQVWSLLNDESVFHQYIADEVKAFLAEV